MVVGNVLEGAGKLEPEPSLAGSNWDAARAALLLVSKLSNNTRKKQNPATAGLREESLRIVEVDEAEPPIMLALPAIGERQCSASKESIPLPYSVMQSRAPDSFAQRIRTYTTRLSFAALLGTRLRFCSQGPAGLRWYRQARQARLLSVREHITEARCNP